ncbi:hypothetical protein STEG23_026179 [Scotinomys teguina]
MAWEAGQGKEEEESRARQQEEKTPDRHEDKMLKLPVSRRTHGGRQRSRDGLKLGKELVSKKPEPSPNQFVNNTMRTCGLLPAWYGLTSQDLLTALQMFQNPDQLQDNWLKDETSQTAPVKIGASS